MLQVRIWRGSADGAFHSYQVPRQDSQTVLDVVTWVQRHADPTLSYRFACRVGMCGSCAMTVNGKGDIRTKQEFGDVQLHIEWRTPSKVEGESQGRGNSGVFLAGRYEVQILDSYDNRTYSNGQAGSIYKQSIPAVNASRPPGARIENSVPRADARRSLASQSSGGVPRSAAGRSLVATP